MEFTPPETDFLTDSYSLENGGFRKWRGFGRTKNPPFSRFYCTCNRKVRVAGLAYREVTASYIMIVCTNEYTLVFGTTSTIVLE